MGGSLTGLTMGEIWDVPRKNVHRCGRPLLLNCNTDLYPLVLALQKRPFGIGERYHRLGKAVHHECVFSLVRSGYF